MKGGSKREKKKQKWLGRIEGGKCKHTWKNDSLNINGLNDSIKRQRSSDWEKKKRVIQNENKLMKLYYITRHNNICNIGIPKGGDRRGQKIWKSNSCKHPCTGERDI